jgi:hypothetical protein
MEITLLAGGVPCAAMRPAWRLLFKCKLRPVVEVIGGVFGHQAAKMALVEHDDMIEQVALDRCCVTAKCKRRVARSTIQSIALKDEKLCATHPQFYLG